MLPFLKPLNHYSFKGGSPLYFYIKSSPFLFCTCRGKSRERRFFFAMMVLSLGFLGCRLGLSWGSLGDLLGTSWEISWGFLSVLSLGLSSLPALLGLSGVSWGLLGLSWGSLGPLWGSRGSLGGLLGSLGGLLGSLGLSWALLGLSWRSPGALLGLSGGLLGRSWGQGRDDDDGDDGPCGPLGLVSSFGPSWLPLLGPNLAHLSSHFGSMLAPFLVYFLIIFWVSFRTYFLEASWALLWPRSRPGERKKEPCATQKLSKPLVFTVYLACRLFCFFRASWCRLGALLAPTWPLRVDFWTPKCSKNWSQKWSKTGSKNGTRKVV